MRKQYNKRPEIVYVGDYTTEIPFYIEFFVTEHLLNTPDILTPQRDTEGKSPRIGATSIYRLIGDGSTEPTFHSSLTKASTSANYDVTQGIVNVIEFFYDGETFWYTIVNGLPVKNDAVQDKGEGPTVLSITVTGVSLPIQGGSILAAKARVTVKELLVSVGYEGTETITYGIGRSPNVTVFNTDPLLAYLDFDCAEVGPQMIVVSASTPSIPTPAYAETFAIIFDNDNTCTA
jgi:hypothetical protein